MGSREGPGLGVSTGWEQRGRLWVLLGGARAEGSWGQSGARRCRPAGDLHVSLSPCSTQRAGLALRRGRVLLLQGKAGCCCCRVSACSAGTAFPFPLLLNENIRLPQGARGGLRRGLESERRVGEREREAEAAAVSR